MGIEGSQNGLRETLRAGIAMHWLRPEVGLALSAFHYFGRDPGELCGEVSLDMACGDGTSTFFRAGGRFDFGFDVYQMGTLDNVTYKEVTRENVDVFDHFDGSCEAPSIKALPRYTISYGMDHKESLLKKAACLGLYDTVKVADLNVPIPLKEESVDLCYCNSVYWGRDPEASIRDMWRLTKPRGYVVLEVVTDEKPKQSFLKRFPQFGPEWARILDRGRVDNNPGLKSRHGWEAIFKKIGATLVEVNNIFPNMLYQVYNVGLRPMFPVLRKMAGSMTEHKVMEVKHEMVELFTDLFLPLLGEALERPDEKGPQIRLQYILKKA